MFCIQLLMEGKVKSQPSSQSLAAGWPATGALCRYARVLLKGLFPKYAGSCGAGEDTFDELLHNPSTGAPVAAAMAELVARACDGSWWQGHSQEQVFLVAPELLDVAELLAPLLSTCRTACSRAMACSLEQQERCLRLRAACLQVRQEPRPCLTAFRISGGLPGLSAVFSQAFILGTPMHTGGVGLHRKQHTCVWGHGSSC
jgi:hypothetical protein